MNLPDYQNIRAVIVDDERLARNRVRRMLSTELDVVVAGEFSSGVEAAEYLARHGADVLFLDIQMPVLDGFGLLERLDADKMPVIVFITAHDEHAVRAFDVHAFDYLLKPFDRERFSTTMTRVRKQLAMRLGGQSTERLYALMEELRARKSEPARFPIKTPGRVFFVRMDEIDWVEAADNYVTLHVGQETHLLRLTMNALESRLDSEKFLRIHRSSIVNADRIKELRPWFHGEYVVLLHDGKELMLSRSYREKVLDRLGR